MRFDRSGSVTLFSGSVTAGPGPRDRVQAAGLRPSRTTSQRRRNTCKAIPTRSFTAKAQAARVRPQCAGAAFQLATDKVIVTRRKRYCRARAQGRSRRRQIRLKACFPRPEDQPDYDDQGVAIDSADLGKITGGNGAGTVRDCRLQGASAEFSERLPRLRSGDRQGNRSGRHRALQRGG